MKTNILHDNQVEAFVSCGAVAGIYARTDSERGVWKAPAGTEASMAGLSGLSVPLTDGENGELNPLGINCLRVFPATGGVVWGARTLQGDDRLASEWKYVPVRRTALFIELDHVIVGRLEVKGSAKVSISNSIVDAGSEDRLAYAGPLRFTTEGAALDTLTVENSTIFGRVHTAILNLASNSIFSARQSKDGAAPLLVERRQEGCTQFSYIPPGSQVPQRRYHCRPEPGDDTNVIVPHFTSRHYGDAGYAQLRLSTSDTIRSGADDQAEMGAFHDLFQPQRTSNLQLRLQEYLRFGFETGIIFMT